jgi:FdhD protein
VTGTVDEPERTVRAVRVVAVRGGRTEIRPDRIVGEEPMEIRAAGPDGRAPVSVAVTMRTPGHDEELAVGFLVTEGLIRPGDVTATTVGDVATTAQPENEITVHLARSLDPAAIATRNFVATASCGICGKASLDQVAVRCDPLGAGPLVAPAMLVALPAALRSAQALFEATGGIHAAGRFDAQGGLLLLREDVGRHNALDKLVGAAALAGELPLRDRVLLVSGRVSFEIVQKAAMAGIPIVAAISAPTDLAVDAARRLSMTLIGFLRGDGFNVYTGEERVALGESVGRTPEVERAPEVGRTP